MKILFLLHSIHLKRGRDIPDAPQNIKIMMQILGARLMVYKADNNSSLFEYLYTLKMRKKAKSEINILIHGGYKCLIV